MKKYVDSVTGKLVASLIQGIASSHYRGCYTLEEVFNPEAITPEQHAVLDFERKEKEKRAKGTACHTFAGLTVYSMEEAEQIAKAFEDKFGSKIYKADKKGTGYVGLAEDIRNCVAKLRAK